VKRFGGPHGNNGKVTVVLVGRKRGVWTWQATTGVCGVVGGILAGLIGLLMLAVAWLTGHQTGGLSLYRIGNALLLSTIPLVMLGAHCLDLSDRREAKRRRRNHMQPKVINVPEHKYTQLAGIAALLLILLGFSVTIRAQQTIFNVPTTDVLDRGKVYAELDVSFKPTDSAFISKFSSLVPRVVVGAGGNVEIGLNLTGNIQPGPDTTTLVPTAKWKLYQGKDNGWAFVVGDNLFIPVRNRAYNAGNYVYAEISKTFEAGARITAGGYDFTHNVVSSANRAGGQFGFEQPLNKRMTFAADWFTGKNSAGYFTPGVVFKVGPQVTGYAGYSIGNQSPSRGNHFFLMEVGYNFN
jgi:hypothetical protein